MLLNSTVLLSQISSKGTPPSTIFGLKTENIATIEMPYFDTAQLLQQEEANNKAKPYTFAKAFDLDLDTYNSGTWQILPNGDRLWRLALKSANAYSLNIIFDEYELPEGAALYLYNEDKSFVLGAFTNLNNKKTKVLPTSLVPGDKIIIEYYEPKNVVFHGKLHIGRLSHDYKGIFSFGKDGQFGLSGSCNIDINCPEGDNWQMEKHAVCRIIMNGTNLCTGTLLNNTNNDATPYFLTANHCTGTPYDTWVFYFNYESPACNGTDGSVSQTISGCQLKATTSTSDLQNLDFCLVEMTTAPPLTYAPYYAGWNRSTLPATNTTGIHHPSGDVKKISIDNDAPVTGNYNNGQYGTDAHWQILEWDAGTTEGGSSGSALFDENHRVIGDLTGGQAACGNSVNDYYLKFDLAWNYYSVSTKQLQAWLDPAGTNPVTLNGYDPNGGLVISCEFVNNFDTEPVTYYDFASTKWGYWTGQNEYGWTQFAEKFTNITNHYVHGINIPCAIANDNSGNGFVTFKIWSGGTTPGTLLASVDVLISDFATDAWNYLPLDTPVVTDGNFFAGYEVYYGSTTDEFAIYQVHDRYDGNNTAYIYDGGWKTFSSLGLATSLALDIRTCVSEISDGAITKVSPVKEIKPHVNKTKPVTEQVTVYPNPANDVINVFFNGKTIDNAIVEIFDVSGKLIKEYHGKNIKTIQIGVSELNRGLYLMHITTDNNKTVCKITVAGN